ncbi:hypothetical protein [Methanoculleus sp. 10]|uniref:hypothetical protein n=1 Tax=Methanoculleus sp. 10 TaxID=430615 RepID=UPI0025D253EE|nr:hypothetical protein [Methanoculleus sp. 10]
MKVSQPMRAMVASPAVSFLVIFDSWLPVSWLIAPESRAAALKSCRALQRMEAQDARVRECDCRPGRSLSTARCESGGSRRSALAGRRGGGGDCAGAQAWG